MPKSLHKQKVNKKPSSGFDPIWDKIYAFGHEQKAPWDMVVSFIFKNVPDDKKFENIKILEVGCGTASNLRFFAREGFQVFGIDASAKAIEVAKNYFKDQSLIGDLQVGSFDNLHYNDEVFDLVIDRAALVHTGTSVQKTAIAHIHRVLKPGGKFLYTPYADTHSSALSAQKGIDGLSINISSGLLQGVGHMRFVSRQDINEFFPQEFWSMQSIEYETRESLMEEVSNLHASWRVIVEKKWD